MTLPAGQRCAVALPNLPGTMADGLEDEGLRALIVSSNKLNEARIQHGFSNSLAKRGEAPLVIPHHIPGGFNRWPVAASPGRPWQAGRALRREDAHGLSGEPPASRTGLAASAGPGAGFGGASS